MLATALSRTATAKMKLVLPAIAKKDHVRIRGKTLLADQTARSAGPIYLVRNVCVNWPTGLNKKTIYRPISLARRTSANWPVGFLKAELPRHAQEACPLPGEGHIHIFTTNMRNSKCANMSTRTHNTSTSECKCAKLSPTSLGEV